MITNVLLMLFDIYITNRTIRQLQSVGNSGLFHQNKNISVINVLQMARLEAYKFKFVIINRKYILMGQPW